MFHFIVKPSPPKYKGRETFGNEVDSSASVMIPGTLCASSLNFFRNSIASRFSRPPYLLGIHSPALRE